jgi:GNAT superfamily N-acetyltransferase
MIRPLRQEEYERADAVINEAAMAYKGVIPADRFHEPYMPMEEFLGEISAGVRFYAKEIDGRVAGLMGIQDVDSALKDVTLIRHAYVADAYQRRGVGGELLTHLLGLTQRPMLIGTWADAIWAVRFYEKHGFRLTTPEEKNCLLRVYWNIPERQVETSVVLVDEKMSGMLAEGLLEGCKGSNQQVL